MTLSNVNVSVVGATGYTGVELVKLLCNHDKVSISYLTSNSYSGQNISNIYPYLKNICDKVLVDLDIDLLASESDIVFLCLPHKESMVIAQEFFKRGVKVIDLSADFRFSSSAVYESTYNVTHSCPYLLKDSVYGLAEIYYDSIKAASLVAVPGCYPTSILIPMLPLINEKVVDTSTIIADSKSGVSGAGRKLSINTHFCEVYSDFKPYSVLSHRHKPEIDNVIKEYTGETTDIIFTPHLLPIARGMLSTIYFKSFADDKALIEILKRYYSNSKLVRIIDTIPSIKNVVNTAFIDIGVYKSKENTIIISAIDNLIKGASGQALQCMNLNLGLDSSYSLI